SRLMWLRRQTGRSQYKPGGGDNGRRRKVLARLPTCCPLPCSLSARAEILYGHVPPLKAAQLSFEARAIGGRRRCCGRAETTVGVTTAPSPLPSSAGTRS